MEILKPKKLFISRKIVWGGMVKSSQQPSKDSGNNVWHLELTYDDKNSQFGYLHFYCTDHFDTTLLISNFQLRNNSIDTPVCLMFFPSLCVPQICVELWDSNLIFMLVHFSPYSQYKTKYIKAQEIRNKTNHTRRI